MSNSNAINANGKKTKGKKKKAKKVKRLRRHGASTYLLEKWGISRTKTTLAKLATLGGGPIFEKDGRIPLYTPENLDKFAREQLSAPVRSTAELDAIKREEAAPAEPAPVPE